MPETPVQQLEKALATIEAMKAEHASALAAVTTERDTLKAALADEQKKTAESAEAMKGAQAALTAKQTELDAMKADLDKARAALANPAFAAAAAVGSDPRAVVPEGGAASNAAVKTQAEWLAEYRKLDGDAQAQKAFRVAHWRELGIGEEK